ncbi:translation initiation factor 2 [Calderihabitans maritimus]|uniref:Translation initiation factor 2 n=1 Tax=Calderihabitans maritimus TaxID=1246530 RepID=A0A1Z5HQD9_9FIRM|nr:translation initiation factor 2 [Calderihabitans maritimus]GAW91531.1 hypothetical protein TherJR_1285 [Calderihabitans maritimus]
MDCPRCKSMKLRLQELEERVNHLRVSRRVLINLLEKVEREKSQLKERLEKENRRLLRTNVRYAHSLWQKNRRIRELEMKLVENQNNPG